MGPPLKASQERPSSSQTILRFGTFELDVRSGDLRKQGLKIRLSDQPFRVLRVLLEHPGDLVTREELRHQLWRDDTFVEFDVGLNNAMRKLRGALGDSAENPTFVETLPRRGYRFIAPVALSITDRTRERAAAIVSVGPRYRFGVALASGAVLIAFVTSSVMVFKSRTATESAADVELVKLTTNGNSERAAIGPDGKYVAYIQRDAAAYSLWIRQMTTGQGVQILPPEPGVVLYGATISPDSSFVDFIRRSGGRNIQLWRIPLPGGPAKLLVDNVHSPINWSPDGQRFAFIRAEVADGSTRVVTADPDGTHERMLAYRQRPAQFLSLMLASRPCISPAWSPSGRTMAVAGAGAHGIPRAMDVDFIDAAGGSEHTMSIPSEELVGLGWIDEASLLLNAATHWTGAREFLRFAYPGGRMWKLTNDVSSYSGVSLTADRRSFVTTRTEVRAGIWTGEGSGRNLVELEKVPGSAWGLDWNADHLLYVTDVSGHASIWSTASGVGQQLIPFGIEPASTSNGDTIVFSLTDPSRAGLWKADSDGGRLVQIVPGDADAPIVTRDDASVIFLSARTGVQTPWIVSIKGGPPRQLVNILAASPGIDISPDGTSIVFISRDSQRNRVWITCELPDCVARRTFLSLSGKNDSVRWGPDGRSLAYVDNAVQNVWFLPLDGAAPYPLTHFSDLSVNDFRWSRDGRRLALSRSVSIENIVLFKGLRRRSD